MNITSIFPRSRRRIDNGRELAVLRFEVDTTTRQIIAVCIDEDMTFSASYPYRLAGRRIDLPHGLGTAGDDDAGPQQFLPSGHYTVTDIRDQIDHALRHWASA